MRCYIRQWWKIFLFSVAVDRNMNMIFKNKYLAFAAFVLQRMLLFRVPQVAGSLTYTTLLALVPLLTVMLVVITAFPMFSGISDAFMDFVRSTIVPSGASVVSDYLQDFKTHAGRLTSIGIVMMIVTSMLLVQTIDDTFNRIWQVRYQRSLWVRLPIYWLLLTLGPVVIGLSVSVSAYFMRLESLHELPYLAIVFKRLGQIAFSTVLFCGVFRIVPNRYVSMKNAFLGGLVTAILLEIVKAAFAFYIRNFNSYELVYGAFAAIPVFLVWLQLLWMIVLGGAVLTASLSYWQGGAYRFVDRSRLIFDDVVSVLIVLAQAQQYGRVLHEQVFRQHIPMGYDQLGELLENLANKGYVENSRHGWLLKTIPENIFVNQLFDEFVCRVDEASHSYITNHVVSQLLQPDFQNLKLTLADVMQQVEVKPLFDDESLETLSMGSQKSC